MPCDSYGYPDENPAKIRELTALLCEACSKWGQEMPESVRLWWEAHQAQDRAEMEQMKRQRKESAARLRRQREQIERELAELEK